MRRRSTGRTSCFPFLCGCTKTQIRSGDWTVREPLGTELWKTHVWHGGRHLGRTELGWNKYDDR